MARVINPAREQFDQLVTPLTQGELRLIDLFDETLSPEWEMYVQPHLNGLRPDLVLLHPRVGVAVFEVKDWNLAAMEYYAEPASSGHHKLMARDRNGQVFSREADNPLNKILLYKEELYSLYCPRLDSRAGLAVITAGLVFPCSPRILVNQVFDPFRTQHQGMRDYPNYYPLAGAEDLASRNMEIIFPESKRTRSREMTNDIADDLRGWLKEPFFSQEQRRPLELDSRQRELAETRTETGLRRIKGPAGSGKSVVLAARASSLAAAGKHILVVSYNITLLNYLRDLAVRHDASRKVIRRQVDFLNFHNWCKRICTQTGNIERYKALWASSSNGFGLQPGPILESGLAMLVQNIYRDAAGIVPKYDAILVDEGQDFRPSWWQTLRMALKEGGEMVLVADKTQNVYGTASAWTEDAMANAGFRGPWSELKISYRLPPAVIPLVSKFAREFMADEEIDFPEIEQRPNQLEFADTFPVELRWVHVDKSEKSLEACISELRRMMHNLRADTAIPDITFLSDSKNGRYLVAELEKGGVKVLHTFSENKQQSRRQKRAFFQGSARVKATTLQSFKGWEARHLILFVDSIKRAEDKALLYTALTRLRRHEHGSCLAVVSGCQELRTYGESWPDFEVFL